MIQGDTIGLFFFFFIVPLCETGLFSHLNKVSLFTITIPVIKTNLHVNHSARMRCGEK